MKPGDKRRTLNIIGGGKVGKTLARLWVKHDTFEVQDVLNRTPESTDLAVAFIGAGHAAQHYADMRPADVWMITATDDLIAQCCEALAGSGRLTTRSIVFHCSGALSSAALAAAAQAGAATASVHPVRSFVQPEQAVRDFAGTYCGTEGMSDAIDVLNEAFISIGAQMVPIDADSKILYHSAAVFACNYLVTLLDVAVHAYAKSGVPQDVALRMLEPLVRGTVDNVFRLGPPRALTGPIARGDMETAATQARAVASWNPEYGMLYEQFVTLTAELAARRNRGPLKT